MLCSNVIGRPSLKRAGPGISRIRFYRLLRQCGPQVSTSFWGGYLVASLFCLTSRPKVRRRKSFRLARQVRSGKFVYGDAGGDCHGLLGDELKGTDHFAGYLEFVGFRLHNGRVFEMR